MPAFRSRRLRMTRIRSWRPEAASLSDSIEWESTRTMMFRAGKFSVAVRFLKFLENRFVQPAWNSSKICAWNDNSRGAHRDLVDAPFRYASELETIMRRVIRNNRLARADRAQAETSHWRHEPTASVSKIVAIAFYWDRKVHHQVIRTLQIGKAREMHVQHHRRHRL